ncbi:MAG: hypothetical protein SGILL_001085, partial [Bacillariaceae sp.]
DEEDAAENTEASDYKEAPNNPSDPENAPDDEKNASMADLVKSSQQTTTNGKAVGDASTDYVAIPDPPSATPNARKSSNAFVAAEMMLCGQVFHESGTRELVRVGTMDSTDAGKYHPPQAAAVNAVEEEEGILSATAALYYNDEPADEFQAKLAKAYPLNKVFLVGCAIWSISFLFDPNVGGFRMYANAWNILGFLVSALVGPLFCFPMRRAVLKRSPNQKKKVCWAVIATLFLRSRRMGITWDTEGKPKSASKILVQNLGTPLLFWGVLLYWVGTNVVRMADLNQTYLPIWTTVSRSWCVFIAGMLLIFPAHMALDLAFDQGSQPVVVSEKLISIYKLDGIYCVFLLPSLWNGDLAAFTKWTFVYYALMIAWSVSIGIGGGVALLLSIFGVAFVLVGHRWDLYERKRGIAWLDTELENESSKFDFIQAFPQVFGIGLPLTVVGWLLLCLGMSIPM